MVEIIETHWLCLCVIVVLAIALIDLLHQRQRDQDLQHYLEPLEFVVQLLDDLADGVTHAEATLIDAPQLLDQLRQQIASGYVITTAKRRKLSEIDVRCWAISCAQSLIDQIDEPAASDDQWRDRLEDHLETLGNDLLSLQDR